VEEEMAHLTESWDWLTNENNFPSYCITFAKGQSTQDVLERYGAPADGMQFLSLTEAMQSEPRRKGAPAHILRVGEMAGWSFCFEMQSSRGAQHEVLEKISQGTEAISLSYAEGLHVLCYYSDGVLVEEFETPNEVRGTGPYMFSSAVRSYGTPSISAAALSAVSEYIGARLTESHLLGVLPTVFLFEEEFRTVQHHQGQVNSTARVTGSFGGLGRPLGTLQSPDQ
jgi:hypothetical protein